MNAASPQANPFAPPPRRPLVLLAAGGTGGHIYPAVALAEALAAEAPAPGVKIQFCCGARPAELEIYRRLKIKPWVLPVSHNRPGLRERLKFLGQMLAAWRKTRRRLARRPAAVAVGFGSYVSVAPLLAARLGGARLVLHEQNVRAGLANRLLGPLARRVATAVDGPVRGLPAARQVTVGNPVRSDLIETLDRAEARRLFRLQPDRLVCLCLGGSQGAAGLNRMLLGLIGRMLDPESPSGAWQLLWSTGTAHYKEITETLARMEVPKESHVVVPYIERMGLAYAAADVVVARAGALTMAELTAMGRPSVLVPLPTAGGGHQWDNARNFAQSGAAVVLDERAPDADAQLERMLGAWVSHPGQLAQMAEAARAQGRPDAARALARIVLEQIAPHAPA